MAWYARRYAPYPRWRRHPGWGFLLWVSRDWWRQNVFYRRDGKWEVEDAVFERLEDAFRYGEVAYYRRRAEEIETGKPTYRRTGVAEESVHTN